MRRVRASGRCASMVCSVKFTGLFFVIPLVFVIPLTNVALPTANASTPSFETSIDYTMHRLATEHNDPSAQYLVGRNFLKGKSVDKNIKEAIKWFEMAAKQNHIRAQYQLGKLYLYGDGIKRNLNYAFYYLSKSAGRNHLESLYELGNYYLFGDSGNRQYEKAIAWFRKAAARDHVKAQYELGKLLYEGKGGEQKIEEGTTYLKLASESGLLKATDYLADIDNGNIIFSEVETLDSNTRENSTQNNNFAAAVSVLDDVNGNESSAPPSPTVDNQIIPDPANTNIPTDEKYKLGIKYLNGENNIKNIHKAASYFQLAADEDHAKSQYQLAKLYKQGIGVEKNATLYRKWLTRAADAGVQNAQRDLDALNIEKSLDNEIDEQTSTAQQQYELGLKYYNGDNKKTDHVEAAKWFLKAAQQNHHKSQYQLGIMYEKGIGFNQNFSKAKRWYKMAANSGLKEAKLALQDIRQYEMQAQFTDTGDSSKPSTQSNTLSTASTTTPSTNNEQAKSSKSEKKTSKSRSTRTQKVALTTITINPEDPLDKQLLSMKSKPIYPILRKATQGNSAAQYEVGLKYLAGEDGLEKNVLKALQWIEQAANNEHIEARLRLGMIYLNGIAVEKNYRRAIEWLEKAAYAGSSDAQLTLGDLYKDGLGVEQNSTTAVMWYRKSANQGHSEARKRLGGCRIC